MRENTNLSSAHEVMNRCEVMRNKFMLRPRSVERRSETIINSTYCRFLFLSAYILRLSNHNLYVFGCSGPGYYFRFVGLLVQYIIIVVDLFHNGLRTCVLFSSKVKSV